MFNIFLQNTIIHNLEYIYENTINNLEEARMFCFFNNYDVILYFKKEKKFWFSKSIPHEMYNFCKNSDLCDSYLIYKYENFLNFNLDINTKKDIENKILFIVHGSLQNYNNENFKNEFKNKDSCFILKNDDYIYKLDKINYNYFFITDQEINLNLIYKYYNILSNIRNKKYKYIMCYNTDILIPMKCSEFIDFHIEKLNSNVDNDIMISNNNLKFLFCKYILFENFLFSKNYVTIKPVQIILNDTL